MILMQERTSKAIFRGKVKEQKPPGKMAMWDFFFESNTNTIQDEAQAIGQCCQMWWNSPEKTGKQNNGSIIVESKNWSPLFDVNQVRQAKRVKKSLSKLEKAGIQYNFQIAEMAADVK